MPSIRPRLSLLTALLLTTIVGLAIVVVQFWWEIGPLREEVRQLRDEVGRLSIEDDTNLHAIEVRSNEEHTWKWRVWVPEGETVTLHTKWGHVPSSGVTAGQNLMALEPGEQWITLSAKRDPDSRQWLSTTTTRHGSMGAIIQPSEHWFDMKRVTATSDGVSNTTYMAPDSENIVVLKRFRAADVNSSDEINKSTEPTAGFIIWLERK